MCWNKAGNGAAFDSRITRLLASVAHPNIAQIYGFEETSGSGCIVMELVEGETLAERLRRGPLASDDVLQIARQIVDALSNAQRQGHLSNSPTDKFSVLRRLLHTFNRIRSASANIRSIPRIEALYSGNI